MKHWIFIAQAGPIAEEKYTGRRTEEDPDFNDALTMAGHLTGSQEAANAYALFMWEQSKILSNSIGTSFRW